MEVRLFYFFFYILNNCFYNDVVLGHIPPPEIFPSENDLAHDVIIMADTSTWLPTIIILSIITIAIVFMFVFFYH